MQMQFFFLLKKHEKPAVHVFRHLRKNLTLKKEKELKKYSRYIVHFKIHPQKNMILLTLQ